MKNSITVGVTMIVVMLTSVAALFTHVINTLLAGKYILLLVGVILPPIGVIHGIGLWFGVQW